MGTNTKGETQRKMRYCADTWFLLELHKKNEKASRIYKETIECKNRIYIPTVSILELMRLAIRFGESLSKLDSFLNELKTSQKIQLIVLDESIAKEAAKISVSYNIPAIDSIIAATCKISGCNSLLTGDEHLLKLHKKKYLHVENW